MWLEGLNTKLVLLFFFKYELVTSHLFVWYMWFNDQHLHVQWFIESLILVQTLWAHTSITMLVVHGRLYSACMIVLTRTILKTSTISIGSKGFFGFYSNPFLKANIAVYNSETDSSTIGSLHKRDIKYVVVSNRWWVYNNSPWWDWWHTYTTSGTIHCTIIYHILIQRSNLSC